MTETTPTKPASAQGAAELVRRIRETERYYEAGDHSPSTRYALTVEQAAELLAAAPASAASPAGGTNASVEAVVRRAKYLLNRMKHDDGIGIGEFDTILRMAASLPPPAPVGEAAITAAFLRISAQRRDVPENVRQQMLTAASLLSAIASDTTANSKAGDEDVRGALAKAVAEVGALQARVSELVRVEHRTFMDAAQINAAAGSDAARDILAERRRQIEDEGWTPEHDDEHRHGEMADAAALYASFRVRHVTGFATWPWDAKWFKPTVGNHRRDLVKAGALILAEIERIDRARTLATPETESRDEA